MQHSAGTGRAHASFVRGYLHDQKARHLSADYVLDLGVAPAAGGYRPPPQAQSQTCALPPAPASPSHAIEFLARATAVQLECLPSVQPVSLTTRIAALPAHVDVSF